MIELPGIWEKQIQIISGGTYLNPSFKEFPEIDCQQIWANNNNITSKQVTVEQVSAEAIDPDLQELQILGLFAIQCKISIFNEIGVWLKTIMNKEEEKSNTGSFVK